MKLKSTYRFLIIISALAVGILLVYLLSVAGSGSKGPIQNALRYVEENILRMEQTLIIDKREDKRKEKLSTFKPISDDLAALKNPKAILFGASDMSEPESFETIIDLEDSLKMVFPLIHIYCAWGSKPIEEFPAVAAQTIINMGSTPVITWEPWLSDFDEKEFPGIPPIAERDKGCLKAIASGVYDAYIIKWANGAKKVNKPIFIRYGHEMNDPYRYPWGPQNNTPEDFISSWQHIRQVFNSQQVYNVVWIWAPHPSYAGFEAFYPGDESVDYVGIGILNFGTVATWSKWWTFDELFASYDQFSWFKKPIMITEFGSLVVGGERSKWFADALREVPIKYPDLKSILFFHYPADKTITNKDVSWYFIDDPATRDSIIEQISLWPDSLKL
ncbi:MAG: hypothetical protein K9H64_03160 [Bacteroidales bacterium]|nr:hypothetical protein [Bacteroidales bacterium]MCF8454458.1 hypothetical protein [Bacteroidales bacterium]